MMVGAEGRQRHAWARQGRRASPGTLERRGHYSADLALSSWVSPLSSWLVFSVSRWLHRMCFGPSSTRSMKLPEALCIAWEQHENWGAFCVLFCVVVCVFFKLSRLKGHCFILSENDIYSFNLFGFLRTSFLNSSLSRRADQRFKFQQKQTNKKHTSQKHLDFPGAGG